MIDIYINKKHHQDWLANDAEEIATEDPLEFYITEAEAIALVERGLGGMPDGAIFFKAREITDE